MISVSWEGVEGGRKEETDQVGLERRALMSRGCLLLYERRGRKHRERRVCWSDVRHF